MQIAYAKKIKMKTLTIIVLCILSLSLVVASGVAVTISLSDASFTPIKPTQTNLTQGYVNFTCDKTKMQVYIKNPTMNIDDDVERAISKVCNKTVTVVKDWTGRAYKQNEYGIRSFDTIKLSVDACSKKGLIYNKATGKCETKKVIIPINIPKLPGVKP